MKINDLKNPYVMLSSGFGFGLFPIAPGTMGSAFGMCVYILIAHLYLPTLIIYLLLTILLFVGWIAVSKTLKKFGDEDHSEIVIDEIIGMMLVATVLPADPYWAIVAFLLFRFFDIVKPYPINKVDMTYKNAFGIIFDDIIAAVYSIAVLLIAIEFLG